MNEMKVIVADDEKLALEGLKHLVEKLDGFTVSGCAANGMEALQMILDRQANIVLTDIRMPQYDGIWLIEQIEKQQLPVLVIVVSAYDDNEYLFKAIHSPFVYDYITKPFISKEFSELMLVARRYYQRHFEAGDDLNSLVLCNCIMNNNEKIIESTLENLLQEAECEKAKSDSCLLAVSVSRLLKENSDLHIRSKKMVEFMNRVVLCEDSRQVIELDKQFFKNCLTMDDNHETASALIRNSLAIVRDELCNPDLNLAMVAEKLNVSANYLSARFSRDMNQTFSSYLTEQRILQAKKLLLDLSNKIFEVAEKVGYTDSAYFNKVFKEKTSLTPKQYREKLLSSTEQ